MDAGLGNLAPLCPSRYGILFAWATPGDRDTPKLVSAPFTRRGWPPNNPVWSRTPSYQPRGWQQAQDKAAGAYPATPVRDTPASPAQGCTGTCGTKAVRIAQRCWVPARGVPVTPPALPSTGSSPLQVKLGGKWDGVPRVMTPKQQGIRSHCLRDPPPRGWLGTLGIGGCRALSPRRRVWLSQHPLSLPLLAFLFLSF